MGLHSLTEGWKCRQHEKRIAIYCLLPVSSQAVPDISIDVSDGENYWCGHGNSLGWCRIQPHPLHAC